MDWARSERHRVVCRNKCRGGGKPEISFANTGGGNAYIFAGNYDVDEFNKLVFSREWENEPGVKSLTKPDLAVLKRAFDGK